MVRELATLVRKLAHNDPVTRKNAYLALKTYLQSPAGEKLKLLDFEKLWKGLYFSMWYCDKPVPQQSLAGDLGELFSGVVSEQKLPNFHRAFWSVIMREWQLIDKWRLDKFLMLVRRVVRHSLFRLQKEDWSASAIESFSVVLAEFPLSNNPKFPQSLAYHVCDLFLDEVEYVVFKEFREFDEENNNDSDSDSEEEDDDEDDEEDEEKKEEDKKDGKVDLSSLSEAEIAEKKAETIAKTPFAELLKPFQKAAESAKNKALRKKIREEILEDERLKTWAVVEAEESESEDEWTGF